MPAPYPHWSPVAPSCPRPWRTWLMDKSSLTRRLQTRSQGHFAVAVLAQGWQRPRRDEARALGIPSDRLALIREVVLQGHGDNWVFARSVLPRPAAQGRMRRLHRLGNKPLGEWLFRHPGIQRGPLWLARWPIPCLPSSIQHNAASHRLWARYSLFRLQQDKLLVSEIFLPALLAFPPASPDTTGPDT